MGYEHPYVAAGRALLAGESYDNRTNSGSIGVRPGEYDGVYIRGGRVYHAGPAGQSDGMPYGSRHDDVTDQCLTMARQDIERDRLMSLHPELYQALESVGYNIHYVQPTETGCTLHLADESVQAVRDALPQGYELRCCLDPGNLSRYEIGQVEKLPRFVGLCEHPVVWDGRGYYRRDPAGRQMAVFMDRSPYPCDQGHIVYGVSPCGDTIGFSGDGCPWTSATAEAAFRFGNGVPIR